MSDTLSQKINRQAELLEELKAIQSLVDVCAKAINDTGTCEDSSAVDVLQMASNRLWDLVESGQTKLKALELDADREAE